MFIGVVNVIRGPLSLLTTLITGEVFKVIPFITV